MVSFKGDEDAAGVGGIELEVVEGLGDSVEVKELKLVGASMEDVAEMNGQALSFDSMWGALELGHARRMFELGLGFAGSWNVSGQLNDVIALYERVREHTTASRIARMMAYARHGRIHEARTLFK
ncbi:hypothetical protein MRB53_026526 [Persea americana]|uniref:Uncharacterized protein n=1 Tax=Persea americana TaxID=3435 RepID=A0ACC2LIL0_PERAE|nr:hypothetical protein MRB53_026526 [Persea americana]